MNPHILLVEDEAAIRQLQTLYLNSRGFDVTTASCALQTLDVIYRKRFDAVVVDFGLGDGNGMDLIEPIKIAQPNAPVFIYTALDVDDEMKEQALSLGAVRILNKMHPLEFLVDEITRGISAARRQMSSQ